jgi:hypothetical protein
MNGPRAGMNHADVAVWTNSMAGQQTVNMDTVGGVADYETEKNACTTAYVDDHDDDRSGPSCLVRISACISVSFHLSHSPIHATFNAHHLPPECPLCNLSHILLPHPILVFCFTSQQLCFLLVNIWPRRTLHHFSRLLLLFAQHLSAGLLPFLPFCTQAANNHTKKTCSQSHIPPSSPHSLQASTRTRTCVRLSMYLLPVAVFISHQKEGFVREETEHKKTPFVVSNTLS